MDIFFNLFFFTFPVIVFIFYKKIINESILKISIFNFLIVNLFVFSYIGIFFLYNQLDSLRVGLGVTNKNLIFNVFLYSVMCFSSLLLGRFIFFKYNKKKKDLFFLDNLKKVGRIKLVFITIISLIVFFLYVKNIPSIALFNIFQSEAKEIGALRSDMGNSFSGSLHWYNIFINEIMFFLLMVFYSSKIISSYYLDKLIFFVLLIINIFISLMATQKAPLIWLFFGLFLTHLMSNQISILPLKKILKFIILSLLILIPMYLYIMKVDNVRLAIDLIFSRTFTGSIAPAYFYLEIFPENLDYLNGASFPNPAGILPFQSFPLTVYVADWVNPQLSNIGIVGSMPTVFWTEIYANFGPILIMPFSVIVGYLISAIDGIINNFVKSPILIGFYVWLIIHFKSLSITLLSNYLFDMALIVVFFTFIFTLSVNFRIPYRR